MWLKRGVFPVAMAVIAAIGGVALVKLGQPVPVVPPQPPRTIVVTPPTDGVRLYYPAQNAPVFSLSDGETHPIHSVLDVKKKMKFGDFVWNDEGVPEGPVWVRVDLAHQFLSVFRAGHEIGTAVILYGADIKETPLGVFPVLQKAKNYHSRTYDAPMPFMLRLTHDGVAIHGSNVVEGSATHGCVGVPPEFAERLFAQVTLGDPVAILRST